MMQMIIVNGLWLFKVGLIRQQLASIYEREQNWKEAAGILVGIPLETAQKWVDVYLLGSSEVY